MTTVFHRQFIKLTTFLTFLICGQVCFGQIEIIVDDESFLKLKDGDIKREIAYFSYTGSLMTKSDTFPKIKVSEVPVSNFSDKSAIFSTDNLFIQINSVPFDTTGHQLVYQPHLILIDNKTPWGTDGNLPKEKISSIILKISGQSILLPDSAFNDLFEPNFCYNDNLENKVKCNCKVFQSADKKRFYIYMTNGDGAGGYEVTWVIQDKKYLTRFIDYGF